MKAVIMAGGEGSRLRPLTCDTPKPMVPLLGKPVMEYIIALLKEHGITDIAVTLQYLPQVIKDYFDDGSRFYVNLKYFVEDKPLGTAGSVKNCEEFLDSDFLVISGDAVCDFNLQDAIKWHKKKNAAVTIVLTRVPTPLEYGVVMTDNDGRVKRFLEKPSWSEVFADTVNTGIYIINKEILKYIPTGTPFDFSKDLFPKLMNEGIPIFGYDAEGYWCDIGDIDAYMNTNFDGLAGKIKLYCEPEGINYNKTDKSFTIIPPVFIGHGVNIGEGSFIGPNVILGDFSTIGKNSRVSYSIIHDYSRAGNNTEIQGAILCHSSVLKKGASAFDRSVIGGSSVIGENTRINPGVKIWNNKTIDDNQNIIGNVVWGKTGGGLFEGDEITGEAGIDITPEICCRLGAAFASLKKGFKCGIMTDGSSVANLLKEALSIGVSFSAAQVFDMGTGFSALLSYMINAFGLDGGLYISSKEQNVWLSILGEDGLNLPRYIERKLQSAFTKDDFFRASFDQIKSSKKIDFADFIYINELKKRTNVSLAGRELYIGCNNKKIVNILSEVLREKGAEISPKSKKGIPHFYINNNGTWLSCKDEDLKSYSVDFTGALTLLASIISAKPKKISYFYNKPTAFDNICNAFGVEYKKILSSPANESDKEARKLLYSEPAMYDALFAVVRIMSAIVLENTTLKGLSERLPKFFVKSAEVWIPANRKSYVMRKLQSRLNDGYELQEGVRFKQKDAGVLLVPKKKGGFNLMVEAMSSETAEEICNFYKREIYRLADNAEV